MKDAIPLLICNHNYNLCLVLPLLESQECVSNFVKSPMDLLTIFQLSTGKVGDNKVLESILPLGSEQCQSEPCHRDCLWNYLE